ncbi:MAG TPA: hypothetical protein VM367_07370 [Pseudonocardia sp.]|nr:hypothetical protein [Pseudonocardia sp.]
MDPAASRLLRTSELRRSGFTAQEVQRMRRCGELVAIRRGTYLAGALPDDSEERHRLLVRATLGELGAEAVISHVSAAVLHGVSTWGVRLDRVTVTRARRSGGRVHPRVHLRTAPLDPAEIVLVDGIAATSPGRTVVDVVRSVPFEQGVVVADSALAARLVDAGALEQAVRRARGWPGAPLARRVVAFADGRSGSVGESRSRVAIARAGLPAPVLQWAVRTGDGRVREVDFGWIERRTVGEFDGRVKYGRLLRPGEDAGEAVYREKVREDWLRAEGLGVARWGWSDLADFRAAAARIRRAFR